MIRERWVAFLAAARRPPSQEEVETARLAFVGGAHAMLGIVSDAIKAAPRSERDFAVGVLEIIIAEGEELLKLNKNETDA